MSHRSRGMCAPATLRETAANRNAVLAEQAGWRGGRSFQVSGSTEGSSDVSRSQVRKEREDILIVHAEVDKQRGEADDDGQSDRRLRMISVHACTT